MKKILLTQGKIALVDDEDYEWLNQYRWYAHKKTKHSFSAGRNIPLDNRKQRSQKMHRLILGLERGDKRECDHIDGNSLNNQRNNLRICSRHQNNCNRKSYSNSTSTYKGVSWNRLLKKWRADIQVNNKHILLGSFAFEKEAAQAYNRAAKKYFGEFARLNKIQDQQEFSLI